MTPTAKDMSDLARLVMMNSFPTSTTSDQVAASFLLTSHYCKLVMDGSDEDDKEQNRQTLEGLVMGLFAQLNPPDITH